MPAITGFAGMTRSSCLTKRRIMLAPTKNPTFS